MAPHHSQTRTLNSEVDGWSPNGQSWLLADGWQWPLRCQRYEESLESRIHMIALTNTILRSHVFGHLPETLSAFRRQIDEIDRVLNYNLPFVTALAPWESCK